MKTLSKLVLDFMENRLPPGAHVGYIIGYHRNWNRVPDDIRDLCRVMDSIDMPWKLFPARSYIKVNDVRIYWCTQDYKTIQRVFAGRQLMDAYIADIAFPTSKMITYLKSRIRPTKETEGCPVGRRLYEYHT